jgi:hypothetical protein
MASPDLQSKVNQLTSKIQGELTTLVDELERYKLRPIAVSFSIIINLNLGAQFEDYHDTDLLSTHLTYRGICIHALSLVMTSEFLWGVQLQYCIWFHSYILNPSWRYSRAGKNGRKEQIEQCTNQCQVPYQMAGNATQQEIGNFQNRLQRAMMQCQDDAQGSITPDMHNDDRKMRKVEEAMLKCIDSAIQKSRDGLKPMKQRIESQLK